MRFSDVTIKSLVLSVIFTSSSQAEVEEILSASDKVANPHNPDTDAGILSPSIFTDLIPSSGSNGRVLQAFPTCGVTGYVDCVNGFVRGDLTTSCATECSVGGGSCCVGFQSCGKFTGKVCKDGSCNGSYACYDAIIPWVVNSCKSSGSSCMSAGKGGTVGNIVNSCTERNSCKDIGRSGGIVGNIQDSCTGISGCGRVGEMGVVGNIQSSCTGLQACFALGYNGGAVGNIQASCIGEESCTLAGYGIGIAGNIQSSCTGRYSCRKVGGDGGSIGSITSSCNAESACKDAGKTNALLIISNLNNCCNILNECMFSSEGTIPGVCKVRKA